MPSITAALNIDLGALEANYRLLKSKLCGRICSAVVKADAYGLGAARVAPALQQAGCDYFFVATLDEGIALRKTLSDATISIFHGPQKGEEKEFLAHRLIPVINHPEQLERWEPYASDCNLHIDTGMTRLGFTGSEAVKLSADPERVKRAKIRMILTHLACANDPADKKNEEQRQRFEQAYRPFGTGIKASMANSSGIFLSPDFHYDLGRPGCAIYGINPTETKNPMQHVATLSAPILQIRTLDRDETVGYGATYAAKKGARLATVQLGYADGWLRHLSNKAFAYIGGHKVPIVGRVSMDMVICDISAIPEPTADARIEFINRQQTVNDVADAAGTIGYEIFTRIGNRVQRTYR